MPGGCREVALVSILALANRVSWYVRLGSKCTRISHYSDEANQEAAVAMVVKLFTEHVKPVIIIGPKVRMFRKRDYRRALVALAENVSGHLKAPNVEGMLGPVFSYPSPFPRRGSTVGLRGGGAARSQGSFPRNASQLHWHVLGHCKPRIYVRDRRIVRPLLVHWHGMRFPSPQVSFVENAELSSTLAVQRLSSDPHYDDIPFIQLLSPARCGRITAL